MNLNQSNSGKTILLENWNEDEQKAKGSSIKYHRALKKHLHYFSQYFTEVTGIIMHTGLCNRVPQWINIPLRIKLEITLLKVVLLFNVLELFNVLDFDIIWVMS